MEEKEILVYMRGENRITLLLNRLLENPLIYSLWQNAHNRKKRQAICNEIHLNKGEKILDIACGPGTNANLFRNVDYLGVDINRKYVKWAAHRYGFRFRVMDVTKDDFRNETFDWILVNSFLHHLVDSDVNKLLRKLTGALTPTGRLVIIDLLKPERGLVSKILEKFDRGKFARSIEEWKDLFNKFFYVKRYYSFNVNFFSVSLWNLCVFVLMRKRKQ